jgi:diadenosine tetraphosphate (Ap4A) HIT family hydrolase
MPFDLDERLSRDCYELGKLGFCRVLLMNNAAVPWFILVPETDMTEVCELAPDEQTLLWSEVNAVAGFVRNHHAIDKLNIAAIGNIVRQLHVHVVGRRLDDYCWPGVVWGEPAQQTYSEDEVVVIRDSFTVELKELSQCE